MDNNSRRVVIYARVSSDHQDVDLSISAQLKALREYASRSGFTVVKEFVTILFRKSSLQSFLKG
jgi:predicted site-specific integrase-resolvase